MNAARLGLVTSDSGLRESVEEVARSVAGCGLAAYAHEDGLRQITADLESHLALLLVHAPAESAERAAHLMRQAVGLGVPVVIICDTSDSTAALQWFRCGATDCLFRPLDLARLGLLIDSLTLQRRSSAAQENWLTFPGCSPFYCGSNGMRALIRRAEKLATREANVLITGETGTGKTHLAALIHQLSRRQGHPFIPLNCAAIPDTLVESELFGHQRGAYTGADREQSGKFAVVGEGTLLLDEVDSLPLATQAKLLHAVENRLFSPLGSGASLAFKGRLLAASNQELSGLVDAGAFRADLYFRLNVFQLEIPPLLRRRDEIPALADSYLQHIADRDQTARTRLSNAALSVFQAHDWPGNVRELHNVLEQAALLAESGDIQIEHLPPALAHHAGASNALATPSADDRVQAETGLSPLAAARKQGEVQRIREALAKSGDNRTRAARELGISRAAFYKQLKKLGLLSRPAFD